MRVLRDLMHIPISPSMKRSRFGVPVEGGRGIRAIYRAPACPGMNPCRHPAPDCEWRSHSAPHAADEPA